MGTGMKVYRNGPVGALQDEYERATKEIIEVIKDLTVEQFVEIRDTETKDPDCRSIQSILHHLVHSGYGYANYIRKQFGNDLERRKKQYGVDNPKKAIEALDQMLKYHLATLEDKWDLSPKVMQENLIKTTWGQTFDLDQLFEHAIVHMLRHRRQIERFLDQERN